MATNAEKLLLWLERYNISAAQLVSRIPIFKQRGRIIKAALTELLEESDIVGLSITITGNSFFDSASIETGAYIYDPESEDYVTTEKILTITGSPQSFIVEMENTIEDEAEYYLSEFIFIPKDSNSDLIKVQMSLNNSIVSTKFQSLPNENITFTDLFITNDADLEFIVSIDDSLKFIIENNRIGLDPTIWPWSRFDIRFSDNEGNFNTQLHSTIGVGLNPTIRVSNNIDALNQFILESTGNESLFGISVIKNNVLIENVYQQYPSSFIDYTFDDPLEPQDIVKVSTIDTGFFFTITGENGVNGLDGFQEIHLVDNLDNVIRSFPLCNYWQDSYASNYPENIFISATPDEIQALSSFNFIPKPGNTVLKDIDISRIFDDEPITQNAGQSTPDEIVNMSVAAPFDQMLFVFDFSNSPI